MHDAAFTEEALAQLPPDIRDSPLFNPDLGPVPASRRNTSGCTNFASLQAGTASR